ncbi:MAG: DUF4330 domain-containing protein [Firmicutes bacterium]|nr:DUF4330 domain-containing protein [Bacillota bacterium]
MVLVDERGRLFGRINLVDLMIVLSVFILIALAATTLTNKGKAKSVPENKTIEYTILLKDIRPDVAKSIRIGDLVKKQAAQASIGKIKSIDIKPAQVVDFDGSRRIVSDSPVDKDVYVTITTKGRSGSDMISTGNEILRAGDRFIITTKWFIGEATIIRIAVKDDQS